MSCNVKLINFKDKIKREAKLIIIIVKPSTFPSFIIIIESLFSVHISIRADYSGTDTIVPAKTISIA